MKSCSAIVLTTGLMVAAIGLMALTAEAEVPQADLLKRLCHVTDEELGRLESITKQACTDKAMRADILPCAQKLPVWNEAIVQELYNNHGKTCEEYVMPQEDSCTDEVRGEMKTCMEPIKKKIPSAIPKLMKYTSTCHDLILDLITCIETGAAGRA